jgi:hypothetical protein
MLVYLNMSDLPERAPYRSRPDLGHPLMQDINDSMFESGVPIPFSDLRLGNAPGPLRTHLPGHGGNVRTVEAVAVTFYRLGDKELKLQPYRRLPGDPKEVVNAVVIDEEVSEEEVLVQALVSFWISDRTGKFTDKTTRDLLINPAGNLFGRASEAVGKVDYLHRIGYIANPSSLLLGSIPEGYVQPGSQLFNPSVSEADIVDVEPSGRAYTPRVVRVRREGE